MLLAVLLLFFLVGGLGVCFRFGICVPAKCGAPDAWMNDVRVAVDILLRGIEEFVCRAWPVGVFACCGLFIFDEWHDVPVVGAVSGSYDAVMPIQYTEDMRRLDVLTPQSKISGLFPHLCGIPSVQSFPIESDLPSAVATVKCVHMHPRYILYSSITLRNNCSDA